KLVLPIVGDYYNNGVKNGRREPLSVPVTQNNAVDLGVHTIVPINTHRPNRLQVNSNNAIKEKNSDVSAVLVTNLCKGYDKKGPMVLNNLCMNVKKGTIYGLLGSSGCGKTSILSCIVGLKKWESGEIEVFGHRPGTKLSGIPGKRLGYVPQDIALYEQLTIKESIQYYGRLYGMREYEILERWHFLVNLLQLPTEFKMVESLRSEIRTCVTLMNLRVNGGQRRRTSLALALVHNPELLILDEPTVGLDPVLRQNVWKHLYKLVQNQVTVIVTSHYIEECRNADAIGVMRYGRLLVEDSPTLLMAQYKTDLLEDVVLKLCWADSTKRRNSRGFNNNNNGSPQLKPHVEDDDILTLQDHDDKVANRNAIVCVVPTNKRERNSVTTFHSKWKLDLEAVVTSPTSVPGKYNTLSSEFDASPVPIIVPNAGNKKSLKRSRSPSISTTYPRKESRAKKFISNVMESAQRIAAMCCIIYLSLIRHPIFFLAALVLPAIEVLLTISTIGKEPKGLLLGVVNEEAPDWVTQCSIGKSVEDVFNSTSLMKLEEYPDSMMPTCNFNELSCKFLKLVSSYDILNLVPYRTTEQAVNDVHKGNLWGYIHFKKNYSEHMLDRLSLKQFSLEDTINGSTIGISLDMSQYLGSVMIIKHLFDGLEGYVKQLIDSCDLGAEQAEIPLHFRPPVYGTLEPNYHNYIIPGVLANIMFMMPFAISAVMFITDLKLGTLGRSRVAGLGTLEIMLGYVVTQGSVVIGQIIICTICLKIGFNFQIVGSTLVYIGITFLLGMCGQAFGLWIGIICKDEIEALITALFILPTMLMFGGVLWPVDSMTPGWRLFGQSLPTTLITETLRSTATRGVDLTHILMWPGLVVTTAWGIFFWGSGSPLVVTHKRRQKISVSTANNNEILADPVNPDNSAVFIRDMCKGYGGTPVLKNLNMNVRKGTIYGLLGASAGGQMRRASLALALVHCPDLLILDEPVKHQITNE
ncbi:ABC transporter G family member 20, partial [Orchesella cincta]